MEICRLEKVIYVFRKYFQKIFHFQDIACIWQLSKIFLWRYKVGCKFIFLSRIKIYQLKGSYVYISTHINNFIDIRADGRQGNGHEITSFNISLSFIHANWVFLLFARIFFYHFSCCPACSLLIYNQLNLKFTIILIKQLFFGVFKYDCILNIAITFTLFVKLFIVIGDDFFGAKWLRQSNAFFLILMQAIIIIC